MKRQHTIRPDFVVANQREINGDPGSRNTLGAIIPVNALQFSANVNSHLAINDHDDFTFFGGTDDHPFSISFWTNLSSAGADSNVRYLFAKWGNEYYAYYKQTTGEFKFVIYDTTADGGGAAAVTFTAPTVLSKKIFEDSFDTWAHITVVYTPETGDDANDETIQFYKNGSPWGAAQGTSDNDYDASQNSTAKLVIGALSTSHTATARPIGMTSNWLFFKHDGAANDAGVTRGTSPLTAADVLELYNGGFPMANYMKSAKGADLVAYWKLDEDVSTATQITDYSPQSNHMSIIGSAVTTDTTSGLEINTKKTLTWAQRRMTIPGLSSLRTNPQK